MFCQKCGKEIPEGQTKCPECGASTGVNLDSIKAGIGAGAQKIKGGVGILSQDTMKFISMIGAVLIILAPFFHWMSMKITAAGEKNKESVNMFGFEVGIITFSAIIFIFVGIILLAWEAADYIPAIANIKEMIKNTKGVSAVYDYIPLILVGVVLLFFLITLLNGDYRDGMKIAKDMFKMAKSFGAKGHINRGLGPIVAFLGIVTSAFPRVISVIKK